MNFDREECDRRRYNNIEPLLACLPDIAGTHFDQIGFAEAQIHPFIALGTMGCNLDSIHEWPTLPAIVVGVKLQRAAHGVLQSKRSCADDGSSLFIRRGNLPDQKIIF
jgi:hypothetical protein